MLTPKKSFTECSPSLQLVHKTKCAKVTRSTCLQWFKTNRNNLGENGTLSIYYCSKTDMTIVQYHDSEGNLMFDADALEEDVANGALKGNAGSDPAFFWYAENRNHAAGGTAIKGAKDPLKSIGLREYYFWFENSGDLALVLFHIFGKNQELFNSFYDRSGVMFANHEELVPHAVVGATEDMETDMPVATLPRSTEEMMADLALDYDAAGYSQLF